MLQFLRKKRAKSKHSYELEQVLKHEEHTVISDDQIKCRICLKTGIIPIYNSELPFDVQDAIRTFGDVEIQEDDSYPKHLCKTCHTLLNGAYLFRKSAKESDRILRLTWTENNTTTPSEDKDDFNISNNSPLEEHTENPYKCETCNLEFRTLDKYSIHKSSKQHKNVRIQCPICHRLYTVQLYKNHVLRHQSSTHLICEVCGKLYRKDNLGRHLQLHSYDLPFQCQVCPYRGRFMESLKIHMRTHSGEKPFSCDKCKLQFITKSNLNRHLLTHNKEKPHKCIECGRGFYTKRDLDVHFKADHSGMKDLSCRMCCNKYVTRKALMRHELRVHKRDKMAKGRMPLYLQVEYRKSVEIIK